MKKIEYADLVAFGASERALNFYNGTDPCEIMQGSSGFIYANIGGDLCEYKSIVELIEDLNAFGAEMEG